MLKWLSVNPRPGVYANNETLNGEAEVHNEWVAGTFRQHRSVGCDPACWTPVEKTPTAPLTVRKNDIYIHS